jgi:hypothetical protein
LWDFLYPTRGPAASSVNFATFQKKFQKFLFLDFVSSKKCVSKSQNPTINASFQGLEPLPQILNKLGRNKKLNPSLANRVVDRCQTLKK